MKIVCAWCSTLIAIKAGPDEISHGICRRCLDQANRNGMEAAQRLGRKPQEENKPVEHNG